MQLCVLAAGGDVWTNVWVGWSGHVRSGGGLVWATRIFLFVVSYTGLACTVRMKRHPKRPQKAARRCSENLKQYEREGREVVPLFREIRLKRLNGKLLSENLAQEEEEQELKRRIEILHTVGGGAVEYASQSKIRAVAKRMQLQTFRRGDAIVTQGEIGKKFYIVYSGYCLVKLRTGNDEHLISHKSPGEWFGEAALLHAHSTRTASVIAVEETTCLVLLQRDFFSILELNETLAEQEEFQYYERIMYGVRVFRSLGPQKLASLARKARVKVVHRNEMVYEYGTQAQALCIVIKGRVSLGTYINQHKHPEWTPLRVCGNKDYFGESYLIPGHGGNRSESAKAEEECALLEIKVNPQFFAGCNDFNELLVYQSELKNGKEDAEVIKDPDSLIYKDFSKDKSVSVLIQQDRSNQADKRTLQKLGSSNILTQYVNHDKDATQGSCLRRRIVRAALKQRGVMLPSLCVLYDRVLQKIKQSQGAVAWRSLLEDGEDACDIHDEDGMLSRIHRCAMTALNSRDRTEEQTQFLVDLIRTVVFIKRRCEEEGWNMGQYNILVKSMRYVHVNPQERIYTQNEQAENLYVILAGEVSLVYETNHSFTNLANLLTGDSFGELSVAGVRIRPTTAIAVSDSLLIKINYSAWQVAEKASLGICLTSAKFSTQAKFNLIRTVDFLRSWNMSKQYRFVTYLGTEEFPKGFTLLRANRPSTHLYFVASGELGVVEHSSNKLLTKLTVSSMIGLSAMFAKYQHSHTKELLALSVEPNNIVCLGPVFVLSISGHQANHMIPPNMKLELQRVCEQTSVLRKSVGGNEVASIREQKTSASSGSNDINRADKFLKKPWMKNRALIEDHRHISHKYTTKVALKKQAEEWHRLERAPVRRRVASATPLKRTQAPKVEAEQMWKTAEPTVCSWSFFDDRLHIGHPEAVDALVSEQAGGKVAIAPPKEAQSRMNRQGRLGWERFHQFL